MNTLKTLLLWLFGGMLVGAAVATLVAPGLLAWNNTPGEGQALCDCVKVTRNTASDLIRAQLVGGGAGSVAFLLLGFLVARAGRKKGRPAPAA